MGKDLIVAKSAEKGKKKIKVNSSVIKILKLKKIQFHGN